MQVHCSQGFCLQGSIIRMLSTLVVCKLMECIEEDYDKICDYTGEINKKVERLLTFTVLPINISLSLMTLLVRKIIAKLVISLVATA